MMQVTRESNHQSFLILFLSLFILILIPAYSYSIASYPPRLSGCDVQLEGTHQLPVAARHLRSPSDTYSGYTLLALD